MRSLAASGFAACAVVLAAASFAWACEPGFTNVPATISANPSSVSVGTSQVSVTGRGWTNGESVALRWSNGAGAGSAIPGGADGTFASSASIPDLPAGNYTLVATQPSGKSDSLSFRITAIRPAAEVTPEPQPGNTGNTAATGPVTPVQGGATGTSTSGGTGSAPAVEPTTTPVPSAGPTPTPSPSATTGGGTSGVIPDRAPAASTAPAPVAEPAPVASIPAIAGGPVDATAPATSVARPRTTPGANSVPAKVSRPATNKASSADAASPERNEATAPSPKTASGELWSGFSQATGPSAGPSLTNLPASSGHATSNLAVGVGMLSAGLVALFAGFGVAEARRRRVLVTRPGG